MKLNEYQLVSLAGFLHDVGKVRQRGGYKIENDYNNSYCPEDEHNKPKYVHAAHTAEFLDWFVKTAKIDIESDDKSLVNVASYHHKNGEGGVLAEIVRKADRLSSGFEREHSDSKGQYKADRLESIFSQVWINNKPKTRYYPIKKLDFNIKPEDSEKESDKNAYSGLYESLLNDIKDIRSNVHFDVFWDALEYVYGIYTWSVPSSSYYSYPRISLLDHSKTTAAIAQALYGFHKAGNTLVESKIKSTKKGEFLLVQGDFSGIQSFIFSRMGESNKYAAKILRARSFYVSLATDLAAYEICRRLNLTKAAIVMNAGGKFTLLLPNTPDSIKAIYGVEKDINSFFEKITFGETRFFIAHVELSDSDFSSENDMFSKKMGEVVKELEIKKLKPEINIFVFEDYIDKVSNSKNGVCRICGKHVALDNGEESICKYCKMFVEIGTNLVNAKYFYITDKPNKYEVVNGLYLNFSFGDYKNIKDGLVAFDLDSSNTFHGIVKSKIASYVPRVSEEEIEINRYDNIKDEERAEKGSIKTFAMIANDAKESNETGDFVGEAFLGILKADVDNLGRIFIEGFDNSDNNGGISKRVSLSRMMDFFFTGWLQNEIKNHYPSVYTVFSGGDDLFLIGPFNQIIDLSMRINSHLKEYTQNEDIHISCGVYFVKPKVPVYQMADEAERILEEAKGKGKDRVSIFGRTIEWSRFIEMMENNKIEELLTEDILSSVKKYTLFTFAKMADNLSDGISSSSRDLMWKPLLIYQLHRNIKNKDKRAWAIDELVYFIEKYKGDFAVPLSYYLYTTRRR